VAGVPARGGIGVQYGVDGPDQQLRPVLPGEAPGRPPVPLPGERWPAEEDARPGKVVLPRGAAPAGELLGREGFL